MTAAGKLPSRPGVARLVGEAAEAGWQLAVASTSAEPSVKAVLEHVVGPATAAGFMVFAGDVVPHKKPATDIYLLALEHLGLPASDAVVIEDSGTGSTPRAQRITCLVTSTSTRDDDRRRRPGGVESG
jgi:HAD superfamily hydrolase (TIGR01509 family)